MPCKRTPFEPNQVYHVWTHANGDDNLFRSDENYRYFLEKYHHHVHPVVDTFAYCLMPNHLHFMIRIKGEGEVLEFLKNKYPTKTLQGIEPIGGFSNVISRQFSHLFNSYTQAFNKLNSRKGSLFIPNFKRKLIDSENYFGTCIAYIHNNPVHHGFVDSTTDWLHSSWYAYVSNKNTHIEKDEGIEWFGNMDAFEKIHRDIVLEKFELLFE